MDKATRNAIERATQQARKLLDEDFSSQLEGTFDVLRSGVIAPTGGAHLSARQQFQRDKIIATIEHKRAAGTAVVEAVTDYVRDSAFTTLNRFVALKMLEARQLVQAQTLCAARLADAPPDVAEQLVLFGIVIGHVSYLTAFSKSRAITHKTQAHLSL